MEKQKPVFNKRRPNTKKNGQSVWGTTFVHWTVKVVLALIILIVATAMVPQKFRSYQLKLDDIAKEEVIAPYTFSILKPNDILTRDQDNAARQIYSVVEYDSVRTDQILSEIDAYFNDIDEYLASIKSQTGLTPDSLLKIDPQILTPIKKMRGEFSDSTLYMLVHDPYFKRLQTSVKSTISNLLDAGIIASKEVFNQDFNKRISIIYNDREREAPLDSIYDRDEAFHHIREMSESIGIRPAFQRAFQEISNSFIIPNLTYDQEETIARRDVARKNVSKYQGQVFKGEIILRSHERVSNEHLIKIKSLEFANQQKAQERADFNIWLPFAGRMLALLLILGLMGYYLYTYYYQLFFNNFHLLALTVIILLMLLLIYFIYVIGDLSMYLIPFATGGILLCVLFDSRLALRILMGVSFMAAVILDYDFFVLFFSFVSGSIGIYTVSKVRHRSEFYRSMLVLPIANVLIVLALNSTISFVDMEEFLYLLMIAVLNGILSPVLTIGLLPIFESVFRISTDITLLELSDSNHPLLRQLALQAPGTFHHSLVVGNLSETAAESIGANSLLVRVASYYHDIGKMLKPEYFVENQRGGENPHNKLKPNMSALILKSHVKEGLRMAREYKLPREVTDIIQQHHGTSLIVYFYHKAKQEDPGTTLTERDFRYDGPKPQTKEAGIIMLADSVEAVSRVLKEPTPSRLRGMVRDITMKKFQEGELDECELTLKDLNRISEAFLHILTGIFHHRIDYPSEKKEPAPPQKKRPESETKPPPETAISDDDLREQVETLSPAD